MSLVKLIDMCLIISVIPFALSDNFLRFAFHMEKRPCTILCRESRLRAALTLLRFVESWRRIASSPQCMLSILQCVLMAGTRFGAQVGRLDT